LKQKGKNHEQRQLLAALRKGGGGVNTTEKNQRIAERLGAVRCGVHQSFTCDCGIATLVPNYFADLNAMHEAEKMLRRAPDTFQPGGIGHYLCLLDEMFDEPITSTAAQRAEAFGLTLGLWKEGE
jgi:hypothetical protein